MRRAPARAYICQPQESITVCAAGPGASIHMPTTRQYHCMCGGPRREHTYANHNNNKPTTKKTTGRTGCCVRVGGPQLRGGGRGPGVWHRQDYTTVLGRKRPPSPPVPTQQELRARALNQHSRRATARSTGTTSLTSSAGPVTSTLEAGADAPAKLAEREALAAAAADLWPMRASSRAIWRSKLRVIRSPSSHRTLT